MRARRTAKTPSVHSRIELASQGGARLQAPKAASPLDASLSRLTKTYGDARFVSGHDFSRADETSLYGRPSRLQPATDVRQEVSWQRGSADIPAFTSEAKALDKSLGLHAHLKACSTRRFNHSILIVLLAVLQIANIQLCAQDADTESWFSLTSEKTS